MALTSPTDTLDHEGPVGLDDRRRPASSRARVAKGLKQSAPFSSLQRRIIFFNLIGLALLVAGMTYLSNDRQNLTQIYVDALHKQGLIIAIGIAEAAGDEGAGAATIDADKARELMSRLAQPTDDVRMTLYDANAQIVADSLFLFPAEDRKSPGETTATENEVRDPSFVKRIERVYDRMSRYLGQSPEIDADGISKGPGRAEEVLQARSGQIAHKIRINSEKELVVSVAVPIVKFNTVLGVLHLSTVGGAIERLVREERRAVIEIFFLAAIVSVLSSIVLANMIASPIRHLAQSARVESAGPGVQIGAEKPEIPDLTHRSDEIGELSGALIRMTGALYQRIDAIESFAADVAHEIKNPLTSLRSAVETMQYAKTDEQRQRLLDVILNDVKRMDRLVTDISNASRLDAELVRERMSAFDMGELIEMLAGVTRSEGEERGVQVVTDLPQSELTAVGLEGRLAQVITNLLGNALSFAPDNSKITVTGRTRPGGISVIVQDQGPGIPPENLDSIFERFYSERPDSEAFGNHSGLGLSISRQIVEAHGGTIWAENVGDASMGTENQGARFIVELPA